MRAEGVLGLGDVKGLVGLGALSKECGVLGLGANRVKGSGRLRKQVISRDS